MSKDTIYREDVIKALTIAVDEHTDIFEAVERISSADRPSEIIYGNDHNCIMTIFGECSYSETGCGDCAVVKKVRKALSADRPQEEWIVETDDVGNTYGRCPICNMRQYAGQLNYCPNCGAKMKGANNE